MCSHASENIHSSCSQHSWMPWRSSTFVCRWQNGRLIGVSLNSYMGTETWWDRLSLSRGAWGNEISMFTYSQPFFLVQWAIDITGNEIKLWHNWKGFLNISFSKNFKWSQLNHFSRKNHRNHFILKTTIIAITIPITVITWKSN